MEQKQKELLDRVFPLVGGKANVARHSFAGRALYVTLKDRGAVELETLRTVDGVTGVELTRGRLKIDLNETYLEEENKMADNKKLAQDILEAVGGKGNVTAVAHCMTRLRLNLKDNTIPNEETVKNLDGVLGVVQAGGQFQIVIGPTVPKVYAAFCDLTGLAAQTAVGENTDAPKEKLTVKSFFSNILNYIAGSMTPLIPGMLGAGLCKALAAILGPSMLGVIGETHNLYILLNFMYDGFFYFLPIMVGFNAAQKMKLPPILGAYMGAVLLAPTFVEMVNTETPFDIFGINVSMLDYSQSVMPVLLSVAFMTLVYRCLTKVLPDSITTIFSPFLSVLISVPVSLIALAPLGNTVAGFISGGIAAFGKLGFIGTAFIGAIWEFLVMTGMHVPVVMTFLMDFMQNGGFITGAGVAPTCATVAGWGVALGAFFRLKNKSDKSAAGGFFISGIIGGITEPTLYGLCMKYKRCFLSLIIGGALGGAYVGIAKVTAYVLGGATNILALVAFAGGTTANMVNGVIACALSLVGAAVATYFIGFSKKDLEG